MQLYQNDYYHKICLILVYLSLMGFALLRKVGGLTVYGYTICRYSGFCKDKVSDFKSKVTSKNRL